MWAGVTLVERHNQCLMWRYKENWPSPHDGAPLAESENWCLRLANFATGGFTQAIIEGEAGKHQIYGVRQAVLCGRHAQIRSRTAAAQQKIGQAHLARRPKRSGRPKGSELFIRPAQFLIAVQPCRSPGPQLRSVTDKDGSSLCNWRATFGRFRGADSWFAQVASRSHTDAPKVVEKSFKSARRDFENNTGLHSTRHRAAAART